MKNVAILGATGFAGEKLIELLVKHPEVKITNLSCLPEEVMATTQFFPRFIKLVDVDLQPIDVDDIAKKAEVVFLALPHTVSFKYVPLFLERGKVVIDLSADYRLKDAAIYKKYYGVEHTDAKNLPVAVYGMPELYREKIKKTKFVANPGCYPTVSILALAPLVKKNLVSNIIIDAKSGVTGVGRKAKLEYIYSSINGNLYPYKLFKHQHTPEINQLLSEVGGKSVEVLFAPHVVPLEQGILVTVYADLEKEISKEEALGIYRAFYKDEFFIRVLTDKLPKLKDVFNTNFCDISLEVQGKKIIIVAAIDNLMKGASSQAVHNMNIMYGFPETAGLI